VLAAEAVFYTVGAVGHLQPAWLAFMLALTPWFLWMAGAAVGVTAVWGSDLKAAALWFAPVFVATFGLEVLGVATGQVFGAYQYSDVLGSKLGGVPPVIGANWVLVVWGVSTGVRRLLPGVPEAVKVAAAALGCVAFDYLLEPVAIGLGYWTWDGGAVPLRNYAAWGLIAGTAAWWAGRFPRLSSHPILGWYVVLQALFFAVLGGAGAKA
jgi:putative membrane protein